MSTRGDAPGTKERKGKARAEDSDVPFQMLEMSSSSGGWSDGGSTEGERVKSGADLRPARSDGEGDDPRSVSGGVGSGAGCAWWCGPGPAAAGWIEDRVIFVGDIVNSPLADGVGGSGVAAVRCCAGKGWVLGHSVEVFRRGR